MPELKIRPATNVRFEDFQKFAKDLELFLKAFTPQLLAEWIKKDKGNLSKKLNGIEPITRNDIRDFYTGVSSVMEKLKNGIHAFQIELEMSADEPEEHKKNLWEEIRLMKATLQEQNTTLQEQSLVLRDHSITLRELISSIRGPQDAPKSQNP